MPFIDRSFLTLYKLCQMKTKLTFALSALVGLCACTSSNYINSPAAHNAAFLREKGDLELTASGAVNSGLVNEDKWHKGHSYGFDVQGAYAVTNNFYLAGGVTFRDEKDGGGEYFSNTDSIYISRSNNFNRFLVTVGGGYYKKIGQSGRAYLNLAAGASYGHMKRDDRSSPLFEQDDQQYSANLIKYHLFPFFNFYINDYFRFSIAPRLYLADYINVKASMQTENNQHMLEILQNNTMFYFEPSIMLQTGFKKDGRLKLNFGLNFATDPLRFSGTDDTGHSQLEGFKNMRSRTFLFTVGISHYLRKK